MWARFKKPHSRPLTMAPQKSLPMTTDSPSDDNGVKLGKELLDFDMGSEVIPLDKNLSDTLDITNNRDFAVHFAFVQCFEREFQLSFSPSSGTIKPGSTKTIKVKLNVHSKINVNYRVAVGIEGLGNRVVVVKIRCEAGVFGVDPSSLEQCTDDHGRRIPVVLQRLKEVFLERGGLEQEGVFRLASEQNELKAAKARINAGDLSSEGLPQDVNAIATLLKIWFRELPTPLLNDMEPERIFLVSGEECAIAVSKLHEPNRTLLDWLLELLLLVAENRRVNKMTAQNLAIVVAPNLYEPRSADPMEGLVMSQKAVQFIHALLMLRAREREKAVGHGLDIDLHPEEAAMQPLDAPIASGVRPTGRLTISIQAPTLAGSRLSAVLENVATQSERRCSFSDTASEKQSKRRSVSPGPGEIAITIKGADGAAVSTADSATSSAASTPSGMVRARSATHSSHSRVKHHKPRPAESTLRAGTFIESSLAASLVNSPVTARNNEQSS
eukprot:m51a1_g7190 hypothetical protein (498) ;mRNA; r:120659-122548